jgi:hypothetical protein
MTNTAVFRGKGIKVGFLFSLIEIQASDSNTKHIVIPPKWWQLDSRHELRIQNISMNDWERTKAQFYWDFGNKISSEIF